MTVHELAELEEYCYWRHEIEPEIPLRLIAEVYRLRKALAYYAEHAHWQTGPATDPNDPSCPMQIFTPADPSEEGLQGYTCAEQTLLGEVENRSDEGKMPLA